MVALLDLHALKGIIPNITALEKLIYQTIKTTLLITLSIISFSLQAEKTPAEDKFTDIFLARISTDYVSKTYDLSLRLNQHRLISAILVRNNKKNKLKVYPIEVLNKPIVLVKAVGVKLVTLACTNFVTSRGCHITIEYPSNLTIGRFKKFYSKLVYDKNRWQLKDSYNNTYNHLHLKAKKVLGVLIGIKKLIPLFKEDQ